MLQGFAMGALDDDLPTVPPEGQLHASVLHPHWLTLVSVNYCHFRLFGRPAGCDSVEGLDAARNDLLAEGSSVAD